MSAVQLAPDGMPAKWWAIGVADDATDKATEKARAAKSPEIAAAVLDSVNWLDKNQRASRQAQYVVSSRLYGGLNYWSDLLGVPATAPSSMGWINDTLKFNICSSVVDTVTAKISQQKPQAYFLTQGGDYKSQRKAKKLTKFCLGVFEQNDGHKIAVRVFRDAAILGDAFVEVSAQKRGGKVRIVYTYVPAWEIFVDDMESVSGTPRQMYRRKPVDRRVLIAAFPDFEKEIRLANPVKSQGSSRSIGDNVWVYEAWHLPSGEESGDGRHVIAVQGAVLSDDAWTREDFPFARMAWNPRMVGYWSQGLVEQVQNIQMEINKLLITISRSIRLAGSFKWLIANGSKVVREHITNEVGVAIYYNGTKPECVSPPILQPELYQQYERLKRDGYEQAGVSSLAATATKPQGLNSGVALREYNDTTTDRFATIAGSYNDFHLDLARQTIACAREAGGIEVQVRDGVKLMSVKSSELDLRADAFVMRLFAIASLPEEPAGRLQQITEWGQAGLLKPDQVKKLLGYPDTEAESSLQQAASEVVDRDLDRVVEDDTFQIRPDTLTNLQLFYERALEAYNRGLLEELEEVKLNKLRTFITQLNAILNPPADAANGPATGVGGPPGLPTPAAQPSNLATPQAVPQAPPVSDVLPNSPAAAA